MDRREGEDGGIRRKKVYNDTLPHTHSATRMLTYLDALTYTLRHTHIHTHSHIHTHTYTERDTHTHTHTHRHTHNRNSLTHSRYTDNGHTHTHSLVNGTAPYDLVSPPCLKDTGVLFAVEFLRYTPLFSCSYPAP